MREITKEQLKGILEEHKKWLNNAGGARAILYDANLSDADLPKRIIQVGPIGSRNSYTVYNATDDIVQCGCWNSYKGGSLEDFKKRIDEEYPEGQCRKEYLAAIKLFEGLKQD